MGRRRARQRSWLTLLTGILVAAVIPADGRAGTAPAALSATDGPTAARVCAFDARRRDAREDAALAADYLARAVTSSGRFRYRVDPNRRSRRLSGYNVLRHAGAVYALAGYLQRQPDARVQSAMLRAAAYLKTCCLAPLPDQPGTLAIWSLPAVTGRDRPAVAKLGGAGLGLAALTSVERLSPGFTSLGELRGLARFVITMQKQDGSFYSKFSPTAGGRQDRWQSLYYPGEAALGLLMLYDLDPDPRWIQGAARALGYLARSRASMGEVPADHWALIATERLLRLAGDRQGLVDEPALLRHTVQISSAILRQQLTSTRDVPQPGGFSPDGRTTPTATRIEGLLAAARILSARDDALAADMRSSIERGVVFLRGALIRSGAFAGGVPRAVGRLPPDGSQTRQRFNRRAGEIRIDYVQHALSAMLGQSELPSTCRSDVRFVAGTRLPPR
jgi:hypothetical protein